MYKYLELLLNAASLNLKRTTAIFFAIELTFGNTPKKLLRKRVDD